GGFGGKDEPIAVISARLALLAQRTGRAVKIVYRREESIRESTKRHPFRLWYKVGVSRDGKLQAMDIDLLADGGAYAAMSMFVIWRALVQSTGPYEVPHVRTDARAVYTNNPYTSSMRGFGSPQANFAIEQMMDLCAEALAMDPLEFRLKNGFKNGSVTCTGQVLKDHHVSIKEVMAKTAQRADWQRKRLEYSQDTGRYRRGIGLACSYRGVALGGEGVDATGAIVYAQPDGSVTITSPLAENGQGLRTIFIQIAAEELGIDPRSIRMAPADTSIMPDMGKTVASRSTTIGGGAMKKAAEQLRKTIHGVIAQEWGVDPSELESKDSRIYWAKNPRAKSISFREAVAKCWRNAVPTYSFGWHRGPEVSWHEDSVGIGHGKAYFTYVYACHIAEVEVDTQTGKVKCTNFYAAHDVGKAINPQLVEGQIIGGVHMGLGYALTEDCVVENGVIKTLNFDSYKLLPAKDTPEIVPIIVENYDPSGPYGAKCIGEPTNEIPAPAVCNAIAHALGGKHLYTMPATPERVLALIRSEEKK
ncbi:MAG: molybdopterin-dependent oxidoreductase, partial [Deinococcus sp.]|nr:molybdopterin-dependent oxidoreductase [Deinococcus sp.]